ncbi:hypothetical protein [Streptomyces capillispiralis]|uniref:Uncharacterized protein n=1 Tax=Streptomyces capillispiralis TaxID=68182 RepID=A0A561TS05_9ACTN|nr:hypothetical protein [Streptomyces capillispiralis]TWF89901.1 hypothetical protein FHX78_116949 [Streptomyces capillispiralis]GHH95728.1 hypothetical protein GCM10017779_61850 [Streptomyces capillispiralis]
MVVILIAILSSVLLGAWLWSRPLFSGSWRHSPAWFASSALLLLLCAGVTYLVGSLAGASLDPEEACHRAGESYDRAYRRANFEEYTRWFPLHDKCHAGYDLVPAWVNPVLVALPALALGCLAYAGGLIVVRHRTERSDREQISLSG